MTKLTLNKKGQIVEKRLKYRNKKVVVDGINFDSTLEGMRYRDLLLRETAKEISFLQTQVAFPLASPDLYGLHTRVIGNYISDFQYYEKGIMIIEDTKGVLTDLFIWKWKHLHAWFYPKIEKGEVILRLYKKNGVIEDNKFYKGRGGK